MARILADQTDVKNQRILELVQMAKSQIVAPRSELLNSLITHGKRSLVASIVSMSPTITTPAMTQTGIMLGTAAYMSPEQARRKVVDRRADIWAFGCVLFEMLTGRTPFDVGETVSDTIASILKTVPEWSALPVDTPPRIVTLLRRCLQKDPQRRLPHIGLVSHGVGRRWRRRTSFDGHCCRGEGPSSWPCSNRHEMAEA